MKKFAREIRGCKATFTRSTAYEGGIEYEHGLEEGSEECSCGHGSHVVTSDGFIIPTIADYERRRDYDSPAALLGSISTDKKASAARVNGSRGGRPRKPRLSKMVNELGNGFSCNIDLTPLQAERIFAEFPDCMTIETPSGYYTRD